MGYRKAEEILPAEIIQIIQQYVDGESIYIPRKEGNKQEWGQGTRIRQELYERNLSIYKDFISGKKTSELADKYFLSEKSIQRIIHKMKQIA